jgi:hypothetical protein
MGIMKKIIKRFKIWSIKRSIRNLELQVMFFEIPYSIAKDRLDMLENDLKQLENG